MPAAAPPSGPTAIVRSPDDGSVEVDHGDLRVELVADLFDQVPATRPRIRADHGEPTTEGVHGRQVRVLAQEA